MSYKAKVLRVREILEDDSAWSDPDAVRQLIRTAVREQSKEQYVLDEYELKDGGIVRKIDGSPVNGATVYVGMGNSALSPKQVRDILSA